MHDKYGNPIVIGDHVVFPDSGRRGILHRGTIEVIEGTEVVIRTERNTTMRRRFHQVALYTGVW